MRLPSLLKRGPSTLAMTLALSLCASLAGPAQAQIDPITGQETGRALKLADDSPYHDPDIIYLEADELINDDDKKLLTAKGQVEGRYQDRTLRADQVIYNLENGRVVATGNVVLIDANGSSQYADKLELSNELEAGTAADFTSRFPNGAVMGAAFATRRTDEGVDLYNAYYTACIPCEGKNPTWQIKARRVSQDKDNNMIRYKDAVFEFLGVPFFYLPYLSHPDPTAGRASGWLSPFVGVSNSKGLNGRMPYYIALDPYSELTITPRVYQKVNPLLELEYRRKFYSGEINIHGTATYGSYFDRKGDPFEATDTFLVNPDHAPLGKRLRSHVFANGLFDLSSKWQWGFGVQGASDDNYLNRYDLDEEPEKFGLYQGDSRRLVSQLFTVAQDNDFRFSTSAYGFQSLRTNILEDATLADTFRIKREDDSTLPIIAPKIELSKYFNDPLVNGRFQAFSDVTILTRKLGTDYTRATAGANWNKTFITPGGIEAKPFGEVRYDYFKFDPENANQVDFNRTIGQVGADIRWPFIKAGKNVSFIVEPRAQVVQNFGDGKIAKFPTTVINNNTVPLFQDGIDIDLDHTLFWANNKSLGYDFWQKGFRADVGGSVAALWGNSRTSLFLGQSFASNYNDDYATATGLSGNSSDIIGMFELDLNNKLILKSRLSYDEQSDKFRRIDANFAYKSKRFRTNVRYYKIDTTTLGQISDPTVPPEEISGSATLKLTDKWSTRYTATRNLTDDITRKQELALVFQDDCTLVEFIYNESNFDSDVLRDSRGFGIRFSLLTLGDFEPE